MGHHLQVRCGNRDLPDLLRQVQQGGSFAMKQLLPASSLGASYFSPSVTGCVLFLITVSSLIQETPLSCKGTLGFLTFRASQLQQVCEFWPIFIMLVQKTAIYVFF